MRAKAGRGRTPAAFGFATVILTIFSVGYALCEIPSNLALARFGARLWIARIMITWGILAGLTATVTGATSFGVVRFLLGVAEAGFFPGIVLYFTYWFPTYHHARIVSGFLIGLPIAVAMGAPISTALLGAATASCDAVGAVVSVWTVLQVSPARMRAGSAPGALSASTTPWSTTPSCRRCRTAPS